MMSMRKWRHQRTVAPDGGSKTIVRDRITFQLRAPLRPATPVVAAGLRALFDVVASLGVAYRWITSYVAGDKIY